MGIRKRIQASFKIKYNSASDNKLNKDRSTAQGFGTAVLRDKLLPVTPALRIFIGPFTASPFTAAEH